MEGLLKHARSRRLLPTLALAALALSAGWMGAWGAGYFVTVWGPVALLLAALALALSLAGVPPGRGAARAALGLLAAYTLWTFASVLWAANKGDAWAGAGKTAVYLLAFWVAAALVGAGASRRWALAASVLGPAAVAALTLPVLPESMGQMFHANRLLGTVNYYNGEAALLLVPFWVAVYLGGSRQAHPLLRGAVLAGAALSAQLAVLTQSRGAMFAMAASLPVFFLLSGKRLRGLLALAAPAAAVSLSFPELNRVYLEFLNEGSPREALQAALPEVWLLAAGAGLYGLAWGAADAVWSVDRRVVRAAGAVALAAVLVGGAAGALAAVQRVGDPVAWAGEKWEAFRTNDTAGQEQSRYLSVSGSGRYTLWRVAWEDFARHPVLGVGTHNYEATYYRLREQTGGYVRQPHSLPLEVLAERGVVGGALLAGFLAVCVGAGLRERFGSLGGEGRAQVGALAAAVAYWFVHSSAEWFWQMPGVTLPAFLYLALLASPWRVARPSPLRWPLRAAAAAVALAAAAAVAPLYLADRAEAQSHGLRDPREALAAVERAQSLNPWDPRLREREAELAMQAGQWERAERAYRKAIELNPRHFAPYMRLATYYERRGRLEDALRSYREALRRNPLDEELQRKVGWLASSAGRERQE